MKVLALDTSNRPLSVAVLSDDQVLATTTVTITQKHAAHLLPIIESLMKVAGLKPADLDRVVVADGPGSYTGLRIGVTTAKTLADTLKLQLVGVSSLATIAANVMTDNQLVAVFFDGRNDHVFAGVYRIKDQQPVTVIEDQHADFGDFLKRIADLNESVVVLGELSAFSERLKNVLADRYLQYPAAFNLPSAVQLARLGNSVAPVADINAFVPRYLRLTKAEADWQKQHPEEDSSNYVEKV